ncbi:MAG: hypothetical protein IPI90_10415 [Saprospiraceae bacterium]|nr:hypothetical protein [Candidatus Vicinibacter affinis]
MDGAYSGAGCRFYNKRLAEKKRKNPRYKGQHRAIVFCQRCCECDDTFVGMSYDRLIEISPGVHLIFTDAGHILGSASVNLRIKTQG